jgi:hypothetical protein
MSGPAVPLPPDPSLEQLRKQAKDLLRLLQRGDPAARARLDARKPGIGTPVLADVQLVLAREYGFDSWPLPLAAMPSLRGLAVSCLQVDDAALSLLPQFPALRELMPMDVTDDGFRHVGRCAGLERLWCMYCRDTGDAATAELAGLMQLRTYYAGKTRITDRSMDILGRLDSLEVIELWHIAGITDAGVSGLASLPRLRELSVDGSPGVTRAGLAGFPGRVRVRYAG